MNDQSSSHPKKPRTRSPNYPAIDLKTAVAKLPHLFDRIGRHPVGSEIAIKELGYSPTSSSGMLAIAALRAFGLLVDVKGQADSMVKLSGTGLDIATDYDEGSEGWKESVKRAALTPKIHNEMWTKYGSHLPPEGELKRYLVRERGFNDNAVGNFIAEYKATIEFAGLGEGDIIDDKETQITECEVQVGSLVQWTSNGVDQFSQPRKIVGIDGDWAFVEGSPTGILVSQLTAIDLPAQPASAMPPINPFHGKPAAGAAVSQSYAGGFPTISRQTGEFQEFPIYTPSGKGSLSVPAQMTKKAFELLKRQIENSLSVIEATAVVADQQDEA